MEALQLFQMLSADLLLKPAFALLRKGSASRTEGLPTLADYKQEFLPHGLLRDGDLQLRALSLNPSYPPTYRFGMFLDRRPVGSIELRLGEDELGGQIGYGVHPHHRGQALAERSLRLLLPLARRHGFRQLWITCDPDNLASRRTCEKAGAVLQEIVDIPAHHELYQRGFRQKCRFRLVL